MRTYQLRYFNQGRDAVQNDLKTGIPIKIESLAALLNDFIHVSGEMSEMTFERDESFEIVRANTERFLTADSIGHDLLGRIYALTDFANAVMAAGCRIKTPD